MKVVSSADSFDNGICQNPEFASSLEKYRAPAICARVWSMAGNVYRHSSYTLSLSLVRSTQIRTRPSVLGTTTIPTHHSVDVSTGSITPSHCMQSSLSLTAHISGTGTLRGVLSANGCAPSRRRIVYSSSSFPSPVKRFGKSSSGWILFRQLQYVSITVMLE